MVVGRKVCVVSLTRCEPLTTGARSMSSFRALIATLALLAAGLVGPALASAPAHAATADSSARHACTKQAGKCIHRGQKCPKAKKGHTGWDNLGRKNVC